MNAYCIYLPEHICISGHSAGVQILAHAWHILPPLNVCQWVRWVSHGLPSACDRTIAHSKLLATVIVGIVEIINIAIFTSASERLKRR